MNKAIFSPSLMCADFSDLRKEVTLLENAGADCFHIDIMDGEFVSNFALSWNDCAVVRSLTNKPLDVHLMVKKPEVYLPYAFKHKVNIIYIHYESGNAAKFLYEIKDNGAEAGLAINPDTPLEAIQSLLPLVDRLLVMRVHPGFAGRPPVPEVEEKLLQLTEMRKRNFTIAVDGAVSPEVIAKWSARGVEEFILGTGSGLFGHKRCGRSYEEVICNLRDSYKQCQVS